MRNMSFSLTTAQMRARTKTVTRRTGWQFLRRGDFVCAVEKAMGLKKGEQLVRLGVIRVVDVRRERLRVLIDRPEYGRAEAEREGYPQLSGAEFVAKFCAAMGCTPDDFVTRIQFEHGRDCAVPPTCAADYRNLPD